jgi:hypothetical protein
MFCNAYVMCTSHFVMVFILWRCTLWYVYVLKTLRFGTLTLCAATFCNITSCDFYISFTLCSNIVYCTWWTKQGVCRHQKLSVTWLKEASSQVPVFLWKSTITLGTGHSNRSPLPPLTPSNIRRLYGRSIIHEERRSIVPLSPSTGARSTCSTCRIWYIGPHGKYPSRQLYII